MNEIDSWNPFDYRPRKSVLQAAYVGFTGAVAYWAAILLLWLITR